MFARLYSDLEPRPEWLELSRHGLEFLRRHAFAEYARAAPQRVNFCTTPRWEPHRLFRRTG